MATSDSPAVAPPARRGWLSRLLASKLTLVVVAALAVALVVTSAIAFIRFTAPPSSALTIGTPMPSSFALDLVPTSSPFVHRGGTASVAVRATPTSGLDRLELWADDSPYIVIDDPELLPADASGTVSLSLDYVPMRAGAHTLSVRAVDSAGLVAQSSPMAIPTLDLPSETGAVLQGSVLPPGAVGPDLAFRAAPGDTLQSVSNRLGIPVSALHTFSPLPDDSGALPAGIRLGARLPALSELGEPKFQDIAWSSEIKATRTDCVVVVTSTAKHTLRIYGGPGNAALGDIPVDSPGLVLANLPIGPTTLIGLEPGVTSPSTTEGYGPTIPVSVTIPDSCAKGGWEGDAYINGGILITDNPVEDAYLYISVDKGDWRRFPAAEGSTFGAGSGILNDLRSYVDLATYDQIDLEVWSAADGDAARVATGAFCRASLANPEPAGSSVSGGECQPPGASPGATGAAIAATFELNAEISNPGVASKSINVTGAQGITDSIITMNGASDLVLSTTAADLGYTAVMYQFSFFPLSATSPSIDPPGVFHTILASAGSKTAVTPWLWRDMKLTATDLAGNDKLSLSDELALATAKANLAEGRNLVDDLYIRAIAVSSQYAPTTSLGGSSNSINVMMPSSLDGTWPSIATPKVSLVPGVDQSASFASSFVESSAWDQSVQTYGSTAVNDNCFEVTKYPNPNTWNANAYFGPHYRPAWAVAKYGTSSDTTDQTQYDYWGPQRNNDVRVSEGFAPFSDLGTAKAAWPRQDVIYCMDDNAASLRWTEAYEANKEANQCGFGCVMSFVIYGALQGFVIGGPYGALIGAIAGLAVGLISTQNPQFYADLMSVWNAIAGVYNAVFDQVWAFVAATNLFCIGIDAIAGDNAGNFCDDTTQAIGSAVITYYTGLPPRLASSEELDAIADGNAEAAVVAILEAGLAAFGIPVTCDTLSLDSSESAALAALGDEFGVDTGVAEGSDGNLSGCAAIARAFVRELRANMATRTENLMAAITGEPAIPGLVLSPITDVRASVHIAGTPTDTTSPQSCPIIVNQTVTQDGYSYRFPAQTGKLTMRFNKKPIDGSPTPAPQWEGTFPVGVNPQVFFEAIPDTGPAEYDWFHREWTVIDPARNGIMKAKAQTTAKYLSVVVDSPCFAKQFAMSATKYKDSSQASLYAFSIDPRPAVAYY